MLLHNTFVRLFSGVVIVTLPLFVNNWKTNVVGRGLAVRSITVVEWENLLFLDKNLSVIIFSPVLVWKLVRLCHSRWLSITMIGVIGGESCNNYERAYV